MFKFCEKYTFITGPKDNKLMITMKIFIRKSIVESFVRLNAETRLTCIKNCDLKNKRSEVGSPECRSTYLQYQRK